MTAHPRRRDAAARGTDPPLRQRVLPAAATRSSRPAARRGAAAVRLARRCTTTGCGSSAAARCTAWCARSTTSPRRSSRYLEQWTAPTKVHTARPGRQLQAGARGLRATGCRRCSRSTPASCSRTCSTTATSSARPASPSRRPALASVAPLGQVLAIDRRPARRARTAGSTCSCCPAASRPSTPTWPSCSTRWPRRAVVRILLNTNGLLIARDDALLDLLTEHRERVEVYLQYDGHSAEASTGTTAAPTSAGSRTTPSTGCPRAGIFTTLTMTAALGVNDDEIGVRPQAGAGHAVRRRRLACSRVFGCGRSAGIDPSARLTHTGVLARLDQQTGGLVTWRDLTALPCCHPHCCSVGYLLNDDAGQLALAGLADRPRPALAVLDLEPELLANRIADDTFPPRCARSSRTRCSTCSRAVQPQPPADGLDLGATSASTATSGIGTLATLASSALPGQHQRLRRLLGERVCGSPSSRSWT